MKKMKESLMTVEEKSYEKPVICVYEFELEGVIAGSPEGIGDFELDEELTMSSGVKSVIINKSINA